MRDSTGRWISGWIQHYQELHQNSTEYNDNSSPSQSKSPIIILPGISQVIYVRYIASLFPKSSRLCWNFYLHEWSLRRFLEKSSFVFYTPYCIMSSEHDVIRTSRSTFSFILELFLHFYSVLNMQNVKKKYIITFHEIPRNSWIKIVK